MGASSDQSSAKALLKLPHDIARQILDDVPFYRVLAMATSLEAEYGKSFKELLLSLSLQRTFFPDEKYLAYMIDLYRLYQEVLQSTVKNTKKRDYPKDSPLSMNLGSAPFLNAVGWENERIAQRDWLLCRINLMLRSFGWCEHADILPPSHPRRAFYPRNQDPCLFYRYKEYWQVMKDKHFRFATKRQSQIQMLADIFRKYPTYLKKSSDPGLDARSNHSHIVNGLELCAKKYRQDILLKRYIRRESYLYRYDHLPIIPLDKDLHLFLHTIARYPYDRSSYPDNYSCSYSEVESPNLAGLSISSKTPSESLIYPSDIKDDINRIIYGLAYVYTSENAILDMLSYPGRPYLMKRTKFTVYSAMRKSKWPALPTCESCEDTDGGTRCYNCYQALLLSPKQKRDFKNDEKSPDHKLPVLTASSLGIQNTLLVSPKPVFTVPPWPHLESQEGYGFSTVDHLVLAKTLTHFNICSSGIMKVEADWPGTLRNDEAGRITYRTKDREKLDEWDERELQWLESFLRVINWMEAQGLRA